VKGLQARHNLRDHMTDLELILTMLGEKPTKEIAQIRDAFGFEQNRLGQVAISPAALDAVWSARSAGLWCRVLIFCPSKPKNYR
jgi:hypothetical protein